MLTKRQRNVNLKVDWLMKQHQLYRDSKKHLMMAIWETEGLKLTPEQRVTFLQECTTPETITRISRELKKLYPASKAVDNQRFELYVDYKYSRPFEYTISEED